MTYLTRIELNPVRRGYRYLVASPNRLHAAVEASFPRSGSSAGRCLWRLDESPKGCFLFVQSALEPDFTHLVEQAGWPLRPDWTTRPLAPLLDALEVGQRWRFRFAANPVRSGRPADGAPTKRFGHVSASQQMQWFLQRGPAWGFAVPTGAAGQPDAVIVSRGVRQFRRSTGDPVTVNVAVFEGLLEVTDAELLCSKLVAGMGHSKAYGCGLMTLAR